MRNIKFRAWIENAMCYDIAELEFQYFCIVVNDHPSGERGFSIDKAELMQYTGLKDKKRVEIYEGDIVKDQFGQGPVISHPGYFSACGSILGVDALSQEDMTFEVIGNIRENPELIK